MPPDIDINDIFQTLTVPWNNRNRYRVRAMRETDVDIVVAIERDTWGSDSWSSKNFHQALKDPFYRCWILESMATDYIILGYGLQCSTNDSSRITNICLHPYRRGRGLGRILLRHMIDYARETNASTVELQVHTSNMQAYNLYVHHGFRITDYLPRYYSNCSDAYQMRLLL